MRLNRLWRWMTPLLVLAVLAACGAPEGPSIRAEDIWARPAVATGEMPEGEGSSRGMEMGAMSGTGAVFLRLINRGRAADRLIGGRTDVADVVEVHETVLDDEVMKMRMLPEGLEVPAGGEVRLEPGGTHVMLIGLRRDLEIGETFELELEFEVSGRLVVEPLVRQP